jgi:hypothetical protein
VQNGLAAQGGAAAGVKGMQHAGFSCRGKFATWAFADAGDCDPMIIIVDRPTVRPPPCSQPSALSDNVRLSSREGTGPEHSSHDSPALASGIRTLGSTVTRRLGSGRRRWAHLPSLQGPLITQA